MPSDREMLIRHSGSAAVETDMAPFEGALDQAWCHWRRCAGEAGPGHLCGAPKLGLIGPHYGGPVGSDGVCPTCGNPKCPDCLAIGGNSRG